MSSARPVLAALLLLAVAAKASALETLTLARQSDGSWRVAGYFIR